MSFDMKKLTPKWIAIGVGVLVVIVVAVVMAMPKHLSGSYSHTTDLLFVKATDTLKFDGSTVTEYADGEKTNTGTYTLKGDQLEIKVGDYSMTATVSDDKKSFTVQHADGLADLARGMKYSLDK
ncbi:hypothetical protein [Lacticaseibacillus kribbianus]|uniref:hypothetical protein n=1 Tax=Lacticaseibacillus kribbianus TaxID=2926292 RepID=UPI001CD5EAA4|nr:hypothetical protein [Lacticaseibacillus kribbianus]